MMDEARVCSRCQKQTCTPGQRYCKDCKRASKLKTRPSWVGGISAILRRRSTTPILSDPEPLQDGLVVEVEAEAEADLQPTVLASVPPVEPSPVSVLTVTLSLDAEAWADLDDAAARDCCSLDEYLSRFLGQMKDTYAAL